MTISFNNGSQGSCNNSGIKKLEINSSGNLIVTFADNTIQDLGRVVGYNGENGRNFYPNEIGFLVPDDQFKIDEPIGWSYLSLADNNSVLYFKKSEPGLPSEWNVVPFGKGDPGAAGKSFYIDSSGTDFPTTGLKDQYTFYNTNDGKIYYYHQSSNTWGGGIQFRGPQGLRGRFHIDLIADAFPAIADLPVDYCFYNQTDGNLYYVDEIPGTNPVQKQWSTGILFRGKDGDKGDKGDKGDQGLPGKDIKVISNVIDTSYNNALLVIGTCPAGYVVTNIEVKIIEPYEYPVTDMLVRFGGTAQSEIDGTVIAPYDYFDINVVRSYIVNEINHEVSDNPEIISCIFNESVNNSSFGKMNVYVTIAYQEPIQPISDNI